MPDLVKDVASRPSARWSYLTFGTSATWAKKGTASSKRDCPNLVRRGTRLGAFQLHFGISTFRGRLAWSVAGSSLLLRWPLGGCAHSPEAAKSLLARVARPDCLVVQAGIVRVAAQRWP